MLIKEQEVEVSMKYDIDKLHNSLVEILDYVVDICEKNDFSYCLLYGTALGAYRHKGFIPWDDDLDIGMPREDYTKLIKYLRDNPSPEFSLQNEDNEKNWFLTFSKVRKNNTVFIENMSDGLYSNNGLYIDIFPLDFLKSKDSISTTIKRGYINYLKHVLKINACPKLFLKKEGHIKYLFDRLFSFPSLFIDNKTLIKKVNSLMISKNVKSNQIFVAQYDQSSSSAIMEKKIYFPFRQCEFEGKKYFVPGDIEEYLRREYGSDFMTLPPIEKRMTHEPIKVQF